MAWIRGHYARRSNTGRRAARSPSMGMIVLIVLALVLVVYLIAQ